MAKPFQIDVDSIADRPLSIQATAAKYGVPDRELKRVRAFVNRDPSSQFARKRGAKSAKTPTTAFKRKSR